MLLIEYKVKERKEPFPQSDISEDWYGLMAEAKGMGLTIEEVRAFLISRGLQPVNTDVMD